MKKKLLIFSAFILITVFRLYSQDPSKAKFGNLTVADFANKQYAIDSNAHAVVIADIGSTQIQGNGKGSVSLVFKRFKRVHILNKNGFDVADISISLYTNKSDEEKLDELKAVTYNLENGSVVQSKLDIKANVFKDKISENWIVKKFTFPNVKEGSIIELEYTIISDFIHNLQPWDFQGGYPRLWSEYRLSIPEFFHYVFLKQGYREFDVETTSSRTESFRIYDSRGTGATETSRFTANVSDYNWAIKNVPALKEESFTSTLSNHLSRIEFQLAEVYMPFTPVKIISTWKQKATELMEDEQFGLQLRRDNSWMKDIVTPLTDNKPDDLKKAQAIFSYVRDNFTCTSHRGWWTKQTLRNISKDRHGTVADINLLLIGLLRHQKIMAVPVLLSTRDNGFAYDMYPLMQRYNYVVCRTTINGKDYFLDASEPYLGFGLLPLNCYNGNARVIDEMAESIELNPDSVIEKKVTSVFIINDEKGNLVGSMQQTPGYYESFSIRKRIKEKGQDELLKDIKKAFGSEIVISNPLIDSLEKFEVPLGIKYDFDIKDEREGIIYLNPMFGEGYKENPFKSAERYYPVEMPFTIDETYNLQLEVPQGYVVDELPLQVLVKFNDDEEGLFEYRITQYDQTISLRSRIRFKRSVFLPDEYETLREFFNLIVKKHSEQIVFKKKK
jgi:hypothetical protein